MSVLGKKWLIKNTSDQDSFQKLLANRDGLDLTLEPEFHDPLLFGDMEKALQRIHQAIKENQRIIVFGDYDVDGITGTAILVHALKKLKAQVSFRIPNRVNDGYGLSQKYVDEFIEKDIKLIITTDCGISCYNEVQSANQNGIDVIITDHHNIPENVPQAHSIIHPKHDPNYPYDELTGAGVALKLAHALIGDEFQQYLDLAALGTVADIGPLTGENRLIVKKGIQNLGTTKWAGIKKLLQTSSKYNSPIDATTIGYRIAPRINAAGRIGDPYIALFLLLQENYNPKVEELGTQLETLNEKRQQMTYDAVNQANDYFKNFQQEPILVTEHPDWHVGILGLIAGRLAEKHNKPAMIMQDKGETLVGSARSPEYFNVTEALRHCKDLLENFGGHSAAAGFSLKKENLNKFKKALQAYAKASIKNIDTTPTLAIDCHLKKDEISFDFIDQIHQLKPFGTANNTPTFLLEKLNPQSITLVGKEKTHLKFSLDINDKQVGVIGFGLGEHVDKIRKHRSIDLVCNLEKNYFNGKTYLQLRALDFRASKQ